MRTLILIGLTLVAPMGCGGATWGSSCTQDSDCASGLSCLEEMVNQGSAAGGCQSAGKYCGETCTAAGDACPEAAQATGSGNCIQNCAGAFTCIGQSKV